MPKVSVILTSYNHEKYLHEAIDSVLNQTFTDFEFIIWDDCSSDKSWEIINSYNDARIKAFRNKTNQRGVINRAIQEVASGKYIAIHHSDDIWELDKLEKQVNFLNKNPKIGAVFTNVRLIDHKGKEFDYQDHPFCRVSNNDNKTSYQWLRYFFEFGNCLCHPSVLVRKYCYTSCGLYRYGFGQLGDFDMWVRLTLKYSIHILKEKLINFRIHENNMNTSSLTDYSRVRNSNENYFILKNFLKIQSKKELFIIFPEAKNFPELKSVDSVDYCLAVIFLKLKPTMAHSLIGIEILFNLLNDSKKTLNFSSKNLIEISTNNDIFASLMRKNYENELLILHNKNQRLNDKVIKLEESLHIKNFLKIQFKKLLDLLKKIIYKLRNKI